MSVCVCGHSRDAHGPAGEKDCMCGECATYCDSSSPSTPWSKRCMDLFGVAIGPHHAAQAVADDGPPTRGVDQSMSVAAAHIQWKGTVICLDFACDCGARAHVDADFTYNIRCRQCGAAWALPGEVRLEQVQTPTGPVYDITEEDER